MELAIFASIIILVLATFLSYAQRLELQQAVKMQAFREALLKAYKRNSTVSYTLKKDTRIFNLLGGFGQSQPSSTGATVSVMWQKGAAGQQGSHPGSRDTDQSSFSYYQINNDMVGVNELGDGDIMLPRLEKRTKGYDGSESTISAPVGVWNEERQQYEHYDTAVTKREDNPSGTRGRIINTNSYNLSSSITTVARTRFDHSTADPNSNPNPLPEYSDTDTYTLTQRADLNQDNRVEYKSTTPQNKTITGERSWTTEFYK